jgi:hypothetical protein
VSSNPLAGTNTFMVSGPDNLSRYVEHIEARLRADQGHRTPRDMEEDLAVLPTELAAFCTTQPKECLEMVIRALQQATVPEFIRAVGDELLENLLNENSAVIHMEVVNQLRTNRRFRQAFACANYPSVDPFVIAEWIEIFQELGTTKTAERKSLWSRAG